VRSAEAAIVTFTLEDMTGSTTDSIVSNTGVYQGAVNFGLGTISGAKTVNGVVFAPGGATTANTIDSSDTGAGSFVPGFSIAFSAPSGLTQASGVSGTKYDSLDLDDIMDSALFSAGSGGNITITLAGLEIGQPYRVQFLMDQPGTLSSGRSMKVVQGTSETAVFNFETAGKSVLGSFTADAASIAFVIDGQGSARSMVNAMAVFSPVPEPSTCALGLLGLAGLALVAWRRRKRLMI